MYQVTSIDHLQVWAQVLCNGARYAVELGQHGMAYKMARASLGVRQDILGPDGAVTLDSLDILAEVLKLQGKYKQAEEINQRALTGREKVLGVDHPDTLKSVSLLAAALQGQGSTKRRKR